MAKELLKKHRNPIRGIEREIVELGDAVPLDVNPIRGIESQRDLIYLLGRHRGIPSGELKAYAPSCESTEVSAESHQGN